MGIMARRIRRAQTTTSRVKYLHWQLNSHTPTQAEMEILVAKGLVSIGINSDRVEYARAIKALDPTVKVYAYICLSSARTFDDTDPPVAGSISYTWAVANDWVAKATDGSEIEWNNYGGHIQLKVWEPSYHDAWIARATALMQSEDGLYDGIWADNDYYTLGHYSSKLLEGTTTSEQTDAMIRGGLDVLIAKAAPAIQSLGKKLIPNYSEARSTSARQQEHAIGGGICEEIFTNWDTSVGVSPTLYEWGNDDVSSQVMNIRDGETSLAFTYCHPTNERVALYGYAAFLMRANPDDFDGWFCGNGPERFTVFPFYDTKVGLPLGSFTMQGGAYVRQFQYATVAFNPTLTPQLITLPDTTTRTLGERTGLVVAH